MPLTRPRFSQFDTTISSVSDPITVLNKSSTLANIDVGFIINRNGGALANTAIFWNESANTFALAFTTNSGEVPNANISISTYANLQVNTLNTTFVNATGNVSAAVYTGGAVNVSGNILSTGLSVFGNTRIGSLATPGALHTIIGNVDVSGAGTEYFNIGGNILAIQGSFGSVNSTGFINTSGNVSAAVHTGGAVSVTGFINTSGNVSAAQINSATAVVTGSTYVGELFVTTRAGDEGGQLNLAPAVTNTTLVGNVTIDVYQNKLRIWEGGGTNRGGYFDISGLAASVGTNLAGGGGGGTPGGGQGQIQFNSSSAFAGAASLYYFGANGAIVANADIASTSTTTGTMQITGGVGISGNVWADRIHAVNNGNGTNFRVGDDLWLGDINVANTMRLMGQQDNTQAFIRFGNTNASSLGVSGSGPLSWGGVLNVTGNILGATASFGAINSTGFINTSGNVSAAVYTGGIINVTGNILATGLSVFGNTRIGSLAIPGALHTIIGNVDVTGAGTEYFNIGGNILAIQGSFGSINTTGLINTTGNILGTAGILNSLTVNGNITVGNIFPTANNVSNIGSASSKFRIIHAQATQAQYADLAEVYTSDQQYPAGTVVVFGGEAEVTQSRASHDTRIAGVVSTNPAYLMNSTETGVPVALQGRVPCRVLGPVSQGDRVVSSHIAGVAQALDPAQYQPGCIIGKALQAIDSTDISTIEVVVGRV
jgi:hypothetical protein